MSKKTGTASAAKLETIEGGLWDLHHLLDTAADLLREMDFADGKGSRRSDLERLDALVRIARDRSHDLCHAFPLAPRPAADATRDHAH